MSGQAIELLDLIARWIHVIAAIMWVGNSLLFNWLDRNLRPRREADVYGDIWLLHSGGFYLVEKNKGEPTSSGGLRLPNPLHWFKWQAYTTWISGAALLIVVYYVGGRALLVDPAVADLSQRAGMLIGVGTIVAAWILYETVWRFLGNRAARTAGAVSIVLLLGAVWLLTSRLSGRAAYLHVGALLGTLMAANVAFTIVPSQRDLVAALAGGREPSQEIADRAKHRSIHNNYFTFPVIALMSVAHFPSLYSQRGLLPLLTLTAGGAAVRYVLNIRFSYPRWKLALAFVIMATTSLLALEMGIGRSSKAAIAPDVPESIAFSDARSVIDRRCTSCHSQNPSDVSLGVMPAGIAFDTPEQIQALAGRIRERAVTTRTMPPANTTRMTERDRAVLARWISAGATIK